MHPLKNINVWSDAGIIITSNKKIYDQLKLLRNHGLVDRDHVKICGYNSRMDTLQAVVGNWIIPKARFIANQRIKNARYLDKHLSTIQQIKIPPRLKNFKIVYHLYIVFVKERDQLLKYCMKKGIEAKVHYPIPIYRQPAMKYLNHKKGDFPVTDRHAREIITFPCDQHLKKKQLDYIIKTVKDYYN
jgi:dTDP-4-amino-4,6-dideoxygalactose transaminase